MGTTKCIVFWVLLALILSTVSHATKPNVGYEQNVRTHCGYTRYPTLCVQTLTGSQHVDFMSALVNKTISETSTLPDSRFKSLSFVHFISPEAQLARKAMDSCQELAKMSVKKLNQALDALQKSPQNHKSDIQTWLSAVLTYHQTCKDTVENHLTTNPLMSKIYNKMDHLSKLSSNALALVNRIDHNRKTTRRRLLLDDQHDRNFPSWVSMKDRKLLQATEIKANVIVAKDGTGNFETVNEAIKAASGGRFVIYVKAGTYNEKIKTNKDGITLIGDGKYATVISGSGNAADGSSLQETATFTISGDGFIARDIGFHNTAGPNGQQAIAMTIASDHSVLFRCSIAGYQDTLYALSNRQFYRECDIYGTVDFIFGNAAAVFQSCNIVFRRPRSGSAYNVILANGRTDPGQNTGFSIQNCRITVGSDFSSGKNSHKAYLGRPWKQYSRAVVMQTNIDGVISGKGWDEWPGASGSIYKTLYFAEFGNIGPSAGVSGRVSWAGFHVIGATEAEKFTVGNFIGGNSWLPPTGVTYVSGLQ